MLLVTGGAGFIGSNFVYGWLGNMSEPIVNVDKLTYARNLQSLAQALQSEHRFFVEADLGDSRIISHVLAKYKPRAIISFAAESHVDRSIQDPDGFVQTNIVGAYQLLRTVLAYWSNLSADRQASFRFLQVSTDEVYDSLGDTDPPFCETTAYVPNSPYTASKAAADHMARAFQSTYELPVLTINCYSNCGPRQFPEKPIPLVIHSALNDEPIPVYGDGRNVRDGLHVADHCSAIRAVLKNGRPGETHAISGASEQKNIDVVQSISATLDDKRPRANGCFY